VGLSDGNAILNADIEDDEFFARVETGEFRFGNGDVLRADMHVKQRRDEKGLHAEYKIAKVYEVVPAPTRGSLIRQALKRSTIGPQRRPRCGLATHEAR
jgi:hypothetical protein